MPASDFKKFRKTKPAPRTRAYTPNNELLREHFPEFTLRGLTGEEWYRAQNAKDGIKAVSSLLEALAGTHEDKAKAIRDFMGLDEANMPDKLVMHVDVLARGCVAPELDQQDAAWLFEKFPVDSGNMATMILHMTGQGATLGESPGCGRTPASAPPSASDTKPEKPSTNSDPTYSPTAT